MMIDLGCAHGAPKVLGMIHERMNESEVPSFEVRFCSPAQCARLREERPARILAEIHYGSASQGVAPGGDRVPTARLDMSPIGVESPIVEIWCSREPVVLAQYGAFQVAGNDEILFGHLHDATDPTNPAFETVVETRYRELFDVIESAGYPHLTRVWNYFPYLNEEYFGLESYRRFVRARSHAYEKRYGEFLDRLPAATVVGVARGGLDVCFIACRRPGQRIENPRQVSAYHYPSRYGPRSPTFSRAVLQRWPMGDILFISGTSSIVGYQSMHVGDPVAQLEETLRNLDALIDSAVKQTGGAPLSHQVIGSLKVYVRRGQDCPKLEPRLREWLGPSTPFLFLNAELCRRELLVEIEAIARL